MAEERKQPPNMDASTGTDSVSSLQKNNETLLSSSHCFLREVMGGENWLQWHALMDRSGIYDLQLFVSWLLKIADAKLSQGMSTESTNTVGTSRDDGRCFSGVDAEKIKKQLEKKCESDKVEMHESDREQGGSDGSDAEYELVEGNEEESDVLPFMPLADAEEKETRDKCDIDEHQEECKEYAEDGRHENNGDGDKSETLEHRQVEEKKQVKMIGKIICDRLVDAVRSGDVHATAELLDMIDPEEKADILNTTTDMCDRDNPALMAIAIGKGYEMVEILTKHGADVSTVKQDAFGNTPLMLACRYGDTDSVKLLLKHGAASSVNYRNANGRTPLMAAFRVYQVQIGSTTLEDGAPIVPIMRARGNVDLARHLLRHGADKFINKIDVKTGKLPIMLATEEGDVDIAQLLLEFGAGQSLNQADAQTGMAPIMKACVDGNVDMVKLLLKHGAGQSVNHASRDGSLPLHVVCQEGNVDILEALLEHGAGQSVCHVDERGFNALIHACHSRTHNRNAIVKILLQHGAAASVDHAGSNGRTALHYAASDEEGGAEVVEMLLHAGASFDVKNNLGGRTALHIAAEHGNLRVVQLLIQAGASCYEKDKNGRTPLELAQYRAGNDRVINYIENWMKKN